MQDSFDFIRRNSDRPVFTMWSQNLPFCLGGVMISGNEQGRLASSMALRILDGENVDRIPIVRESPNLPMFNFGELKRFGLDPENLPDRSVIINRPPVSFYSQYTLEVWVISSTLLLLVILSFFLSVAVRKKRIALRALGQAKNYITNIIDSMPSVLVGVDASFQVTQWNASAARASGVRKETAIGKSLADVFPRLRPELPRIEESMVNQEIKSQINHLREMQDGVVFEDLTIFPLINKGGPGAVIRIDDVTERVKMEELKLHSENLKDQLMQAQKMDSIGRLAGGVAHDLNNLLVPIIGYAELLKKDSDLTENQKMIVEEVYRAGNRSRDLIQQLLAFSRKQNMQFVRTDLNSLLEDFVNLLQRTIKENIRITLHLASEPLPILADVVQVEQVIMNLVVNASDAMSGGGVISIETGIARSGTTDRVLLSVRDTGMGMDEETCSKIFEPFYSTKGELGIGLGLSTAYGIIKQHSGEIQVESTPGEGSLFRILFPFSSGIEQAKTEVVQDDLDARGNESILIVEDSEQVLNLVKTTLLHHGYKVLTAINGQDALDILEHLTGKVDLLLTDIVMPGINGKELYILAREKDPALKVLFMSGYNDNIISHTKGDYSDAPFIQKPFSLTELVKRVRDVLG